MTKIVNEDFQRLTIEYKNIVNNVDSDMEAEIKGVLNFFDEQSVSIQILNETTVLDTSENIESLKKSLEDLMDTRDADDNFSITIRCDKSPETFRIFSPDNFLKGIETDTENQIKMWSHYLESSGILITRDEKIYLKTDLTDDQSLTTLPQILLKYYVKPVHIAQLIQVKNINLSNYFKVLLARYCLRCLAVSVKDKRDSYLFEGYARVILTTSRDSEYLEVYREIYDVFQVIYEDSRFNTRLGILRNIISVKSTRKLAEIFDTSLIKVLHSNYQIYLRENIKQYIEVKNTTIELMHSLITKANDAFQTQQRNYHNVAMALIAYIFTAIISRFIFKSEGNIFTLEVGALTFLFVAFCMVYLQFSYNQLLKLKDRLVNEMKRLKDRYKNIMHEAELEEIFDQKDIERSFDESDCFVSHLTFQTICAVFMIIIICITVIVRNLY